MTFDTPTILLTMIYSACFALFFASSLYMALYAVHFFLFKQKQPASKQRTLNHIISIFVLGSMSFLLFGLFSFYVTQLTVPEVTLLVPSVVFTLGKYSAPLSLFCFITLFIKLVPYKSIESFSFWLRQEKFYYFLYVINAIFIIALLFMRNVELIVALSLLLYVPHCMAGVVFSYKGLSNITLSRFYGALFLMMALGMMVTAALTIFVGLDELPRWVMCWVYFVFGVLVVALGFVIAQLNRNEVTRVNGKSNIRVKDYFSDIYYALQRNEFYMLYQPKISLKDGKPSGVEALMRWEHTKKGNIPPVDFIPAAEESEIIDTLCEWTITEVVKDAKRFIDSGLDMPIAINFSVKNLHPQMVNFLYSRLQQHEVPTCAVVIEITESLFLHSSESQTTALNMLNDYGIKLSLDDYGVGFSSLSYLDKLGIDEIKIDKSFIINIEKSNTNHIIVHSTIQMGHALGMTVVAEGIENDTIMNKLTEMNCDTAQGFGIAKPMPIDAVLDWLAKKDTA